MQKGLCNGKPTPKIWQFTYQSAPANWKGGKTLKLHWLRNWQELLEPQKVPFFEQDKTLENRFYQKLHLSANSSHLSLILYIYVALCLHISIAGMPHIFLFLRRFCSKSTFPIPDPNVPSTRYATLETAWVHGGHLIRICPGTRGGLEFAVKQGRKGWLGEDPFLFGTPIFRCNVIFVSGTVIWR